MILLSASSVSSPTVSTSIVAVAEPASKDALVGVVPASIAPSSATVRLTVRASVASPVRLSVKLALEPSVSDSASASMLTSGRSPTRSSDGSSLLMVPIAPRPAAWKSPFESMKRVTPDALVNWRSISSPPSETLSSTIGTRTFLMLCPAVQVNVPLVSVKSTPPPVALAPWVP